MLKMRKLLPLMLLMSLFLVASCASDDSGGDTTDDTTDDDGGGFDDNPVATYRITFTPNFTEENFPTDYPSNANFSGILVAVHAPGEHIFQEGQLATDGVKELAETGSADALELELESQGGEDNATFVVYRLASTGGPEEAQSLEITITPSKTSFSFISSLSPSPDWFVGVDNRTLIESSTSLVDELSISLESFDAGTDSGTTYNSDDEPTDPALPIFMITEPPLGNGGLSAVIGTLEVKRTDITP